MIYFGIRLWSIVERENKMQENNEKNAKMVVSCDGEEESERKRNYSMLYHSLCPME